MTTVLIRLQAPDGLPIAGATISAELAAVAPIFPAVVLQSRIDARTDQAGNCSLSLRPNTMAGDSYRITIRHRSIQTATLQVVVPDLPSVTLSELLGGINPHRAPNGALVTSSGGFLALSSGTLVFA